MTTQPTESPQAPMLSVVVPVFNEEPALRAFHHELHARLTVLDQPFEIIYVDDGSGDDSGALLERFENADPRVRYAALSRNFGKEAAMSAGIDLCLGDAVIVMDADGQDPPAEIERMVVEWLRGADVVCMRRTSRAGETWIKRATSFLFYRVMNRISEIEMPPDVGDFRLMSRAAVDALKRMPERTRFMKGLFAWVGFKQVILDYERDARTAGRTKFNYWKLWNFALEGITSFTVAPLKVVGYLGFLTAVCAFVYAAFIFAKAALFGDPVQGFPTLAIIILFLGGAQLCALGVIGEYLARIFTESKSRPLYLLARTPETRVATAPTFARRAVGR